MVSTTGEVKSIQIEIGHPYSITIDEAACPISMSGLYPSIHDIHGTDTFQALALAIEFVRLTIKEWEKQGYRFEFPEGGELPSCFWFEQKE